MTAVTVVSNRLPVKVELTSDGTAALRHSQGGLVSALEPVLRERGGEWVGWAGAGAAGAEWTAAALSRYGEGQGFRLRPVAISDAEHEAFYEGACNRVLWPLLHGLVDRAEPGSGDAAAYAAVNALFAEAAAEGSPDAVWVHDYHLLGAGEALRRHLPGSRLGFFLHIPFPEPEIMLQLPWGAGLLPSLSSFDTLGFQTERDRRHFLEWAGALTRRGLTDRRGRPLATPGLEARTGVFGISVDWGRYHRDAGDPAVLARAEAIRREEGGRTILLGVDRLDYTKGIPQRLRAYAHLLAAAPELRERVVLVQLAVPSRTAIPAYERTRLEIEGLVRTINVRHGTPRWTPVRYLFGSWSHEELLAWYVAADVALVTPLRDGMNLVAKEFMAANRGRGALVLSRYAGAAVELGDAAVLVNPCDGPELLEGLRAALAMPPEERRARLRLAQEHLRRHDVHRWAAGFLEALGRSRREPRHRTAWARRRARTETQARPTRPGVPGVV